MSNYFEGYYYKHQKGDDTLCIIVGRSDSEKFIQMITKDSAWQVPYTKGNHFSKEGIILDIKTDRLSLTGKIRYTDLSPIRSDIMGPFRFFPMECSHGITSMKHDLKGKVQLNGAEIDFTGGSGYIESDRGKSFPTSYTWIQANDFSEPCSVMAAVASIPFLGGNFRGCICVIQYQGKEYRLATYLGVRILLCRKDKILLKQGKYLLEIRIPGQSSQRLRAPENGEMTRTILEAAACNAEFTFYKREKMIFHLYSRHAGFEYETVNSFSAG